MASIKGGYWRSSKEKSFPIDSIPTKYFTHLFYATVEINTNTHELDPISPEEEELMKKFTSTLRPASVKCFLSIGQPDASPDAFSNMASTEEGRTAFIKSSIKAAREYQFDGLDLYWKYPKAEAMSILGLLFKEWRVAIQEDSESNPLELSAVVYFAPKFFPPNSAMAYPFDAIKSSLNFVNLVCYDYYGTEEKDFKQTAEHALLYDKDDKKSTKYGISSWIKDAGVPAASLVMGLPLYGRTWSLVSPTDNGIGAPAKGPGPGNGIMDFTDIVAYNHKNNTTATYDSHTVSTYSSHETDWFGFDSIESIKYKVRYAKTQGLAGYFFWALGMDGAYVLPNEASKAWGH